MPVDPKIVERLRALPEPDLDDPDNPEWMEEDFARARPAAEVLPPEVAAAFGSGVAVAVRQESPADASLTLDPEVLERWKAKGPGWQARANAVLRAALDELEERRAAG